MAVDPRVEARFKDHLGQGEKIVWTGKPRVWLTLTWTDVLGRLPMSLILLSPFWISLAIAADGRPPPTPPIPTLAVLLVLVAARYGVEVWARSRTVYALTDRRRAMTVRPIGPEQFRWADALMPKSFSRGIFGGGTIQFDVERISGASAGRLAAGLFAFRSPSLSAGVWFDGVHDARQVMEWLGAPP